LKDKGRTITTATPDATLAEAVRILAEARVGALVVCNKDQSVEGIISERDVVRTLAAHGAAALDQPLSRFMTKDVRTCGEHDTVEFLMNEMTRHRFRHMPVVDGRRLVGIVSIGDVVKQRIAAADLEAASMREYIATG
jgi:CBS domain-containing protein